MDLFQLNRLGIAENNSITQSGVKDVLKDTYITSKNVTNVGKLNQIKVLHSQLVNVCHTLPQLTSLKL